MYMRHQRKLYLKRVSKDNAKSKAKSPPVVDDDASIASGESHVSPPMAMLPLDPHLVDAEMNLAELGNIQTVDSVVEVQYQSPPPHHPTPPHPTPDASSDLPHHSRCSGDTNLDTPGPLSSGSPSPKRMGLASRGSPSPERMGFASKGSPSPKRMGFSSRASPSPKRMGFASRDSPSPKRQRLASRDSASPRRQHSSRASSRDDSYERPPSRSSPTHPSSPSREDKEAEESSMPAPVRAMIDFIRKSFPEVQASPSHPSSRSFDLSTSAGVTDAATPTGSLLAWCHAMSDAFSDTQQRFTHHIKDGKVCHTLLPTLNKFERVSNSPTQGKELKANPDVLDLLRNRVPDNRHVPISLKEAVAVERSLRSGLESHNFLTWSVVALIRSLHEKKLLPMDDPVISQLQKSFSKACGNVVSSITSNAAFVTMKRRQLLLSHVVPSVSDAQKRNLLSDPFSRQVLFSLLRLWRLLDLPLVIYPCSNHILRPHRRHPNFVVNHILALQPREALQDNLLDLLRRSDPLPLSDSSLPGRVIRASRRSLPEPPRSGGFSEVGALSLSGGRRLPSQLLVGLEGSGGGRLGSGGSAGWLSDPLRPSASSIRTSSLPAGVLPSVHQGSRLNPGASDPSSEGGSRTSPSVSGFLQPSIPRPEGFGVVAPHHRSVDPERLHHLVALPHGDSSVGPSVHPPGRLDDLSRPAGRLPAGSSSSRFASVSSLRGSREVVSVQGPLLRSYNRAPSLHEDYGSSFRHPPQVWGQDASLPGRLAHPGLYRTRLFTIEGQTPVTLHRTWHPGQPHEVVSSSHSVTSVFRHGDSVSALYSSTYSSTSQQPPAPDRGVFVNPISSSVPLVSSSGPPIVPHSSRLWRDAPNEAAPTLPQGPVGLPGRPVPGLLVLSLSRGSSLVGTSGPAARGSESLSPSPGRQLLLGRIGCTVGWGALVGEHHASGLWSPHQKTLSINMRELLAVQYGLKAVGGPVGSIVLRQHHHSRLSSSFRRNVLFHSERHSSGDTSLGGESSGLSPAPVHHGLVKCHSGRPQSPQSGDRV